MEDTEDIACFQPDFIEEQDDDKPAILNLFSSKAG